MVRVAALDLGTNTFRLLIADVDHGSKPSTIGKAQFITRLGGGFEASSRRLADDAIKRSVIALEKFAAIMAGERVDVVNARATEIVRKASNGARFLELATRILGTKVEMLPPELEAGLALKGIMAYNPPTEGLFVTLDVGGGSTEMVLAASTGELISWVSMPLGVVDLAERVLSDKDPPSAKSLAICETEIREILAAAREKLSPPDSIYAVIGTGGTATSIAAVNLGLTEYDENLIQNHKMNLNTINELESRLVSLTFDERGKIFPLGGGREDVIVPGAIITRVSLEIFNTNRMLVSDAGLLEGLAMAGAETIEKRR